MTRFASTRLCRPRAQVRDELNGLSTTASADLGSLWNSSHVLRLGPLPPPACGLRSVR